ncbi:Di-sulfide bridge nucleocytoplasmic transport domain-containing protein [Dissophora ornata]|nr:Di-sulfide bridge nucleocytoplasmic transport domain-containing protein [Dissophora ornata]
MPKPFCQDSQILSASGSASGTSTSRQGSFAFSQDGGSFSRPQSPAAAAAAASSPAPSSPAGSPFSSSKQRTLSSLDNSGGGGGGGSCGTKTAFDMERLRNDVFDEEYTQRSQNRLPLRRDTTGNRSTNRSSSLQQYRGNTRSSFWSDDEDEDDDDDGRPADQDMDGVYDSDEGGLGFNRNKSWGTSHDRKRAQRFQDKNNSAIHRERNRSWQQQVQKPASRGRVWSENVDLPFILSGYVQVAMNTVFVGVLIYIMANFITTIQSDVSSMMESLLSKERRRIDICKTQYYETYRCNGHIGPALYRECENLRACMEQPEPRIGRASVAAETFALIVNSFVNTISYKTMVKSQLCTGITSIC